MTANEALAGMSSKLRARGLPPGIIQAILDAIMSLFKQFCPAMAPAPTDLKSIAQAGLEAYDADASTRERIVLRRQLRRHLGLFSRHLDHAEGACWAIGAGSTDEEVASYAAVWQANKDSLDDTD